MPQTAPAAPPQVRPQNVDAQSRAEDLSLAEIRRAIPRECFQIQPLRAWWTVLRVLMTIAVCPLMLYLLPLGQGPALIWQIPAHVLLWTFYGWALVGLFVIGHDCGHRAFSKRDWVNTLMGHLCMFPLVNSFHTWRVTHDHHHAHTQRRGEEVDWASHLRTVEELEQSSWQKDFVVRLGYALPFGIFFWILWNTFRRALMVRSQLSPERYARERSKLRASSLIMILGAVAIYGGLFYVGGVWAMLKYYGFPATVATLTGSYIITIQHANEHTLFYTHEGWTPLRGQLVSTFDVRVPPWLEAMWCNINIHIPHHVSPLIPWYHLPRAGRAIQQAFPRYYQEQRFGLRHLSWFARTPTLIKNEALGYYAMQVELPVRA